MSKVLLVDDDPQGLNSTYKILLRAGYEVFTASNGKEALLILSDIDPDVILSDVRMPELGGLDFVKILKLRAPEVPVVLMTAFGEVSDAVWAMKQGVVDFLTKPFKRVELLCAIQNAEIRKRREPSEPGELVGSSKTMKELKDLIDRAAPTQATVLIQGESGVGKEIVARLLHQRSARNKGPFVAINCAAIPENLLESELFGFEKGSFTGANELRLGLFENAKGGTLLLDEIGDMPFSLQSKLLRAIEEGEIRRIGGKQSIKTDIRIVASTNQDLDKRVKENLFREDLLFRLKVIECQIPPLRKRLDDLSDLCRYLLCQLDKKYDRTENTNLSALALEALMHYRWPGNVRELSNVLERALVLCQGEITLKDLPEHIAKGESEGRSDFVEIKIGTPLKEVEDILIKKTLDAAKGDRQVTAQLLGVHSRTISRRLEKSQDS